VCALLIVDVQNDFCEGGSLAVADGAAVARAITACLAGPVGPAYSHASFLNEEEIGALLAAPDTSRWIGRRDHALLLVAVQTGLRVSELTGLRCRDVHVGPGAHVRCLGKGRKQRCTPLTGQTVAVLQAWLRERQGRPADPLFPASRGRPLSRDAVAWLLAKHAGTTRARCPSIAAKTITPHVLRHSARCACCRPAWTPP